MQKNRWYISGLTRGSYAYFYHLHAESYPRRPYPHHTHRHTLLPSSFLPEPTSSGGMTPRINRAQPEASSYASGGEPSTCSSTPEAALLRQPKLYPQTKRNRVLSFWVEFFLFSLKKKKFGVTFMEVLKRFVKLLFKVKLDSILFRLFFLVSSCVTRRKEHIMVRLISASVYQRAVQGISMSSMRIFFPPKVQASSPFLRKVCLWFLCSKRIAYLPFPLELKPPFFLNFSFIPNRVLCYSKRFEWHPFSITKIQLLRKGLQPKSYKSLSRT